MMTKHLKKRLLRYCMCILYKINFGNLLDNGLNISIKRKKFIMTSQRALIKNGHII